MKPTTWIVLGVVASAGACKKEKVASTSVVGAVAMPSAPASTADADALWAMAPEGAAFGVVVSPRGVEMADGAIQTLQRHAANLPELQTLLAKMKEHLHSKLGTDELDLAALGLSHDKGFAAFGRDKHSGVMVFPVANLERFLEVTHAVKTPAGPVIEGMTCKTMKGYFVCAEPADALDFVGKGELASHLKLVGSRGDIEVVGAESGTEIAVVGQLARGALVVRGAVKGLPQLIMKPLDAPASSIDTTGLAGFGIFDIANKAPMPAAAIVPGVRADELIAGVSGPVTLTVATGATIFEVHVPFKDTTLAKKLVEQCTSIGPLAMIGAAFKDGVCHIPVPMSGLAFDAWADDKELHVGQKGATARGASIPLGPLADELAKGNWVLSVFGRGTMFASTMSYPITPPQMKDETLLMMRALAMLDELGFGMRKDGDAVRFVFGVRTALSNPDDVVAKLLAIPPQDVLAGKAHDAAKAIADAAPGSPFASDFNAGYGGLTAPTMGLGMLAAVAVPAFMDYMKKSKQTESSLMLNKIAKNAKLYYNANGSFPKGTSKTLPERPCCPNKCAITTAWASDPVWSELDLAIDDPNLFQYSYESKDGTTATALAVGDLDCDGTSITYRLDLKAENGMASAIITEPPANSD
jgi:hypothetical protein